MRLDKVALGLMGVLFVMNVVIVLEQRQINDELRNEIAALNRSARLPPAPSSSNEGGVGGARQAPAASSQEFSRLRADLVQLQSRIREVEGIAARTDNGAPPLNLRPASNWKNAGKETPSAAAESLMWASDSGELDVLAKAIVLDPAAREKAEAILARLPASARQDYDSPEKLIALLLARDGDARAMQILGESKAGDDALVNLRLQKDDGKTKDEGYQFRRTGDGWRLVVPGKAVDKLGKKLAEPPKK